MSHLHGSGLALRTSIPETGIRVPVSASAKGAVLGAPCRPRCRLPGSPCLAPSSTSLLRHPRWLVAGCIPPLNVTEFEQRVLYRRGPAQVGFGVSLSSFHRLTLSSGGILSPEPLRLTRPFGAQPGAMPPNGCGILETHGDSYRLREAKRRRGGKRERAREPHRQAADRFLT
jgi:hypothetical protein